MRSKGHDPKGDRIRGGLLYIVINYIIMWHPIYCSYAYIFCLIVALYYAIEKVQLIRKCVCLS